MDKHLYKLVKKIHAHLSAIEREYAKKGIAKRIRSDWGYAFYTGKFVAYIFILKSHGFKFQARGSLAQRLLTYGIFAR